MPVYQGEAFIDKAIASVRAQTFSDWELIIVDNASTDRTWEIMLYEASHDPRIRVYRNISNIGMSGNWNVCLGHVLGDWIGTLAADDIYLPQALEQVYRAARDPEVVLWAHAHYSVYPNGMKDLVRPFDAPLRISADKMAEILYLRANIFGEISCYFIKKDGMDRLDNLVGSDRSTADLDFWMRILISNKGKHSIYSPEILTETSIHEASDSNRYIRSGQHWIDTYLIMEDHIDHAWPLRVRIKQASRALYCCFKYGREFSRQQRDTALRITGRLILSIFYKSQ